MLKKMNAKIRLAIVLLLMGGFVALTILPHAIGHIGEHNPVAVPEINGDPDFEQTYEDINIDFENGTGYASVGVYAERHDADGNIVGTASASAGASLDVANKEVSYWASAFSGVYGCDENQMPHTGSANAWAKVPGNPVAHDAGGPGDSGVEACAIYYMSAYDSTTLGFGALGHRVVKAGAGIKVHGHGPRISVELKVSDI